MRKSELLKLRTLKATPKMMEMAANDMKIEPNSYSSKYRIGLYMRCQTLKGILKVAFFLPEHMKAGGRLPVYELYINKESGEFLTYDCQNKRWLTAKLDMLQWPSYVRYSDKKWINPEGYAAIKRYLGVDRGGYRGLLDYQLNIRAIELKRKHKRETDPWDMELSQTPELPEDWERWVNKVGIPENYIYYNYIRKGAKTGYCTYCEKEVPIHNPKHNKVGTCSRCRHTVTFKAAGKAGCVYTKTYDMYLFQRCEDGFILREFQGFRGYPKDNYREQKTSCWEVRRIIYDRNAIPISAYYWGDYKHSEMRWIKTAVCSAHWWGNAEGKVYGRTLPNLAKKELKKTGLVETIKSLETLDPEKYLAVLKEVPQLELIAKANLPRLVRECISNYTGVRGMFREHNAQSLTKLFGIHSQQLKRLRENNGGSAFLAWLQYEKKAEKNLPDGIINWFCNENILPNTLRFIDDRMSTEQIYNYVQRQMTDQQMSSKEVLTTWSDYLSMAKKLGMNTDDEIIYRVRQLKRRHDELVEMCHRKDFAQRVKELEEKYPKIESVYKSIQSIYEYADETYVIIVPKGVEDILVEGKMLHHCVGSSERYWDRIQSQESYILFLRKTEDIKKAFYTLEAEPDGTVRQKRTEYDRQYEDIQDAAKFLTKWQKVVSQRITDEEKTLAEKSKKLRNLEFAELKKDKVIINVGDLQGQLLADVLMKDLMVNEAA